MAKDKFVESPFNGISGDYPSNCKGGPGEYDGMPGWPGRTGSPNGVPEKFIDKEVGGKDPTIPDKDYGPLSSPGKVNP